VEAVETLIAMGANVNATNRMNGATPLHMLFSPIMTTKPSHSQQPQWMESKIIRIATSLIQAGAKPDQPDHQGLIPCDWLRRQQTAKTNDPNMSSDFVTVLFHILENQPQTHFDSEVELWQAIRECNVTRVRSILTSKRQSQSVPSPTIRNVSSSSPRRSSSPLEYVVDEIIRFEDKIIITQSCGDEKEDEKQWNDTTGWIEMLPILLLHHQQHDECLNHHPGVDKAVLETMDSKRMDSFMPDDGDYDSPPTPSTLLYKLVDRMRQGFKTTTNHPSSIANSMSLRRHLTMQAIPVFLNAGIELSSERLFDSVVHDAVRRNEFSFVQFLLDNHIVKDVNVRNRQGMTPLQFAARSGHVEMLVRTTHSIYIQNTPWAYGHADAFFFVFVCYLLKCESLFCTAIVAATTWNRCACQR
jgi:ankyrin repeat protein